MTDELSVCAFCDDVPEEIETDTDEETGGDVARVTCSCGASGPWSAPSDDEETAAELAAEAWNRVMP